MCVPEACVREGGCERGACVCEDEAGPPAAAARSPAAAELSVISSGASASAPPAPAAARGHRAGSAPSRTHAPPPAQGPGVRPRCSTAEAAAPPRQRHRRRPAREGHLRSPPAAASGAGAGAGP